MRSHTVCLASMPTAGRGPQSGVGPVIILPHWLQDALDQPIERG
jgi:hypothetical protein